MHKTGDAAKLKVVWGDKYELKVNANLKAKNIKQKISFSLFFFPYCNFKKSNVFLANKILNLNSTVKICTDCSLNEGIDFI